MWKIYESIYIKSKYRPNSSVGGDRNMSGCKRVGERIGWKGQKKMIWGYEMFFLLFGAVVTQEYAIVKTHWTEYLRSMWCMFITF